MPGPERNKAQKADTLLEYNEQNISWSRLHRYMLSGVSPRCWRRCLSYVVYFVRFENCFELDEIFYSALAIYHWRRSIFPLVSRMAVRGEGAHTPTAHPSDVSTKIFALVSIIRLNDAWKMMCLSKETLYPVMHDGMSPQMKIHYIKLSA